ncbi:MAG: hypothetical protein WAO19_10130 [Candidatus Kryptoniota bacterium]
MAKPVGQLEQEFVRKGLEIIEREIRDLMYIYGDVLKTERLDVSRLLHLQLIQLQMLQTLKNMESILLKD